MCLSIHKKNTFEAQSCSSWNSCTRTAASSLNHLPPIPHHARAHAPQLPDASKKPGEHVVHWVAVLHASQLLGQLMHTPLASAAPSGHVATAGLKRLSINETC